MEGGLVGMLQPEEAQLWLVSKVSAYNERQAVEFTFSKHDAVDAQGGSSIGSYWLCDR